MDGDIAPLNEIVALAKKHGAITFIDECHATGFLGTTGRGTDEHCGVLGQIDIINSTLGKALGGGTGTAHYTHGIQTPIQSHRRLHDGSPGDYRRAAAKGAAVFVFQHHCPASGGGVPARV